MSRIATFLIACVLAAASPNLVASPSPPAPPPGDVEILIEGAPQRRFAHHGRWYVEAINGREYEIRLRNPYGVRAAVALSVDGLNTIDARETTAVAARKWVLEPYQTVTISGWQTSRTDARRFEFTTEAHSYAQALGKGANLGVISAAYFKERPRVVLTELERDSQDRSSAPSPRPAPSAPSASNEAAAAQPAPASRDEYAATGMGRRTDHPVTRVWLDLEDAPAKVVDIRYEFRPQLVRLGILPGPRVTDPLQRRERSRGFEPGFSPEPPRKK
ncbi:MAG TPA: hypothetical protein VEA16_08475 [Vicinamibacterales bacterium]|nr:hypothetical protein [Vicinamibacterales bacterium]